MATQSLQPAGFHDFSPQTMLKRQYMIDTLQSTFRQYGFLPLQTPAIEYLDTLNGKYGQEEEKLLFKILNTGDFLAKTTAEDYQKGHQALLPKIVKKGLRYDLTIPLARYIATHKNNLNLPFKCFQIQPVWRAEKPQKNRYREFYQADIDIIGSNSLFCEADMIAIIYQIADRLQLKNFTIQINHRLIFKALAEQINAPEKEINLCRTLDKLDKIGQEKVIESLYQQGFTKEQINQINWIFTFEASFEDGIRLLKQHIATYPAGKQAIADFQKILYYTKALQLPQHFMRLTPTLARGLDYYTGTIFEVKVPSATTSIAGGGRYDKLTTLFGLAPTPSIGLSFGVDRLYHCLEEQKLLPENTSTCLLILPLTPNEENISFHYLQQLRRRNLAVEIYPAGQKPQKALSYAHKKNIPWVAMMGEREITNSVFSIKHMPSGKQEIYTFEEVLTLLQPPKPKNINASSKTSPNPYFS